MSAPKAKRILHLTLHRQWFKEIASGRKTEEYRARTDYWRVRLVDLDPYSEYRFKQFKEIHFRNGYAKDAPFMRVEWKGCLLQNHARYGVVYTIQLGRVLETRNWAAKAAEILTPA